MSDGRLWFNTKIDNSEAAKDLKDLKRRIMRSQESISKFQNAKLPLTKQAEELGAKLDAAKAKVEKLKSEMATIQNAMGAGEDLAAFIEASTQKAAVEASLKSSEKEVSALQKQWNSVNDKLDDYDRKILQANADIDRATEKAAELNTQLASPSQVKMVQALDKADKSAQKFGKRLLEIGKSALVFNLVSSGLRSFVNYMGTVLKSNSEYTAQLAQLKGALLTAFQPIYEFILPGLIAVLRVITAVVQALANVFSFFGGKTATQSAKNAQALNKQAAAIGGVGDAAEEASKQLMGFDEINRLESADVGTDGGGGGSGTDTIEPDFSGITDMTDDLLKILGIVTAIAAGLATWKIASMFTDSLSLAAGLGLAVGGAFLYAFDWADAFMNGLDWGNLSGMIIGLIAVVGGLYLAFGNVAAAVGLLIGSIGLIIVALEDFERTGEITDEMLWALAAGFLGIGAAVSLLTGSWIPAIIGAIAAVVTALATQSEWIKTSIIEPVLNWFLSLWQTIKNFFDWLVSSWNNIWSGISNFSVSGTIGDVSGWNMPAVSSADVPALAQGAVLPANRPFMAMVGDQRNGTNIEAPLETIKQALTEVMAQQGWDINVKFTGDLAALARVLAPVITKEQRNSNRGRGG